MDFQQFILKHIDSVDHLRTLLLLRSEPTRAWGVMDVSARLYLEPRQVTAVLASLKVSGLVIENAGSFLYGPRDEELAKMVDELAKLDRERPVTLIKLIYSRPDTLEAFADAFKLRRED